MCRINDDTMQKRLLAEPKAVDLAQRLENTDKNVKLLHKPTKGGNSSAGVHKARSNPIERGSGTICFRCGNLGHTVPKCRVDKSVTCHECGKTGHLKKACKLPQKGIGLKRFRPETVSVLGTKPASL